MKARVITGIAAAVAVNALILLAPAVALLSVALVVAILACFEFDRMFFAQRDWGRLVRISVFVSLTILSMKSQPEGAFVPLVLFFFSSVFFYLLQIRSEGENRGATQGVATELMGFVYVILLFGFLMPIASIKRELLLLLFFIVFLGDTGAYFVGIKFGKRRLAPHVSPKKSIEGSLGGVVTSLLGTFIWFSLFPTSVSDTAPLRLLLITPVISLLGQLGDLFESMLKRGQSQKDSGALLPGHGGILDRVDGLVFAAPFFYLFLQFAIEATP